MGGKMNGYVSHVTLAQGGVRDASERPVTDLMTNSHYRPIADVDSYVAMLECKN